MNDKVDKDIKVVVDVTIVDEETGPSVVVSWVGSAVGGVARRW